MKENQLSLFGDVAVISKKEQQSLAEKFVALVKNGEVSPLQAYAQVKGAYETLNFFLKNKEVTDSVISECQKYGKGEVPMYKGVALAVSEGGVKYDFTVCNDPILNDLMEEKAALDEKIKERQKFLIAVPAEGIDVVDPDTGEVFKAIRPAKSSTTVVRVTFPKE